MECKLLPENVIKKLNSWKIASDGRDAIKKEFLFKTLKMLFHL